MGKPKHGVNSAKTKACKKYKDTGRLLINKADKAKKIAAGKKIKSRKTPKTIWMKWDRLIRNTPKARPYCDTVTGIVYWGTNKDDGKDMATKHKRTA